MNRAQRRQLKASVVLNGGPMDGWVVKPEADALRADWHTTWNTNIAPSLGNWAPGRYVRAADGKSATWAPGIEVVTE